MLIIKRISWWPWTRVSMLVFKEPATQVNNDVFLKKQYYLWLCLPLPGNYYRQSLSVGATFWSEKLPATWFMCPPQLLLYYNHYYYKVAITVILLQLLCREESWRKTIKIEMRGVLSPISFPQKLWMWTRDKNTQRVEEQVMSLTLHDNWVALFNTKQLWAVFIGQNRSINKREKEGKR